MDCPRCGDFNSMLAVRCSACRVWLDGRPPRRARARNVLSANGAFVPAGRRPALELPFSTPLCVGALVASGLTWTHLGTQLVARAFLPADRWSLFLPAFLAVAVGLVALPVHLRWLGVAQRDALVLTGKPAAWPPDPLARWVAALLLPLPVLRRLREALDPDRLPHARQHRWVARGYRETVRAERPEAPGVAVAPWGLARSAWLLLPLAGFVPGDAAWTLAVLFASALGTLSSFAGAVAVTGLDRRARELDARARALRGRAPNAYPAPGRGVVGGVITGVAGVTFSLLATSGASPNESLVGCAAAAVGAWLVTALVPTPRRPGAALVLGFAAAAGLGVIAGPASLQHERLSGSAWVLVHAVHADRDASR